MANTLQRVRSQLETLAAEAEAKFNEKGIFRSHYFREVLQYLHPSESPASVCLLSTLIIGIAAIDQYAHPVIATLAFLWALAALGVNTWVYVRESTLAKTEAARKFSVLLAQCKWSDIELNNTIPPTISYTVRRGDDIVWLPSSMLLAGDIVRLPLGSASPGKARCREPGHHDFILRPGQVFKGLVAHVHAPPTHNAHLTDSVVMTPKAVRPGADGDRSPNRSPRLDLSGPRTPAPPGGIIPDPATPGSVISESAGGPTLIARTYAEFELLSTPFIDNMGPFLDSEPTPANIEERVYQSLPVLHKSACVLFILSVLIGAGYGASTSNDNVSWIILLVYNPALTCLSLLAPFALPFFLAALRSYTNARLLATFELEHGNFVRKQVAAPLDFDNYSDSDEVRDTQNTVDAGQRRRLVFHWLGSVLRGDPEYLPRCRQLVHSLGNATVICCVDKTGILSETVPAVEKVFILSDVRLVGVSSTLGSRPTTPTIVSRTGSDKAVSPLVKPAKPHPATDPLLARPSPDGMPELTSPILDEGSATVKRGRILDISRDALSSTGIRFEDRSWEVHLPTLKAIGLNSMVCGLAKSVSTAKDTSTREEQARTIFASGSAGLERAGLDAALTQMGREVGFADDVVEPFTNQLEIFTTRSRQSTKPVMRSIVSLDKHSPQPQMFSRGIPKDVLDYCASYWDGTRVVPLSEETRTEILKQAEQWKEHTDLTVVALAYSPVTRPEHVLAVRTREDPMVYVVEALSDAGTRQSRAVSDTVEAEAQRQRRASTLLTQSPGTTSTGEGAVSKASSLATLADPVLATLVGGEVTQHSPATSQSGGEEMTDGDEEEGSARDLGSATTPMLSFPIPTVTAASPLSSACSSRSSISRQQGSRLSFSSSSSSSSSTSSSDTSTSSSSSASTLSEEDDAGETPQSRRSHARPSSSQKASARESVTAIPRPPRVPHHSGELPGQATPLTALDTRTSNLIGRAPAAIPQARGLARAASQPRQAGLYREQSAPNMPSLSLLDILSSESMNTSAPVRVPSPAKDDSAVGLDRVQLEVDTRSPDNQQSGAEEIVEGNDSDGSEAADDGGGASIPLRGAAMDVGTPLTESERELAYRELRHGQVFLGMVALRERPKSDMQSLIEGLKSAGVRFVYFSTATEKKTKLFATKLGLETDWNCCISLREEHEIASPSRRPKFDPARMPRGVSKVRDHLKNVDNVPLLVQLFSDCTPQSAGEMMKILRENGEIVTCIGSSQHLWNAPLFAQADGAIAIDPATTRTAQRLAFPFVKGMTSEVPMSPLPFSSPTRARKAKLPTRGPGTRDQSSGAQGGTGDAFSITSSLMLHTAMVGMPCSWRLKRGDHAILLADLIWEGRRLLRNDRQALAFALACTLTFALVQLGCRLFFVPNIFDALQSMVSICIVHPWLALSILAVSPSRSDIMSQMPGKNLPVQDRMRFFRYYLCRFLPTMSVLLYSYLWLVIAAVQSHGSVSVDMTTLFKLGVSAEDSAGPVLVAQSVIAIVYSLYLAVHVQSFAYRTESLSTHRPPLIMVIVTIVCVLFQTVWSIVVLAAARAPVRSVLTKVHFHVWILLGLWPLAIVGIDEFVKRYDRLLFTRYQKKEFLLFNTKLGMHSPI